MRQRSLIHLLRILLLFLELAGCSDSTVLRRPRSISADQIASTIHALPRYARFTLSGVAFFKNKLYASSNVGLLVLSGAKLESLYEWVPDDDVVEGPWLDAASDSLWIQHAHDNSLWRFDGAAWHPVPLPVPPTGFTRGDVLAGFLGIGSATAFWFVGGGHAWRFQPQDTSWIPESEPPAPQHSAIRAIAPLSSSMLYIVREGIEVIPPSQYAVYNRENKWARQNISDKMDFGSLVTSPEGAYVRAEDGRLFLIDSESVQTLETPGRCEAIAQTSTGRLLASFVDRGIFSLDDDDRWDLQFSYPHGKQQREHWAYLAESNGQIAYAISSVPGLIDSGSIGLWVQHSGKLERVWLK